MSTQRSYVVASPLAAAVLRCLHVAGHAGEGVAWLLVAATCNRAGDGLDMAEVCGVVPRMPKEMLSSRSPIADRLYTRSVARVIVRRERLITTSSGK